jgi:hypothetical protein
MSCHAEAAADGDVDGTPMRAVPAASSAPANRKPAFWWAKEREPWKRVSAELKAQEKAKEAAQELERRAGERTEAVVLSFAEFAVAAVKAVMEGDHWDGDGRE